MSMNRRKFIATSLAASAGLASVRLLGEEPANSLTTPAAAKPIRPEPKRGPRQDLDLVFSVVKAGHGKLAQLKELIAHSPALVFAAWDWGDGDWETALGGAAHIGSRECARFLLAQGARIDAFCAAMLGARDALAGLISAEPAVVTGKGPHGYTLLYHAAISGDVAMAALLKPQLAPEARDYSQALGAAVRDGHLAMTKWLFENGPVNPNTPDALGRRPLTLALSKGFTEVADELRRHGAREVD
jgi:hypothetical protein